MAEASSDESFGKVLGDWFEAFNQASTVFIDDSSTESDRIQAQKDLLAAFDRCFSSDFVFKERGSESKMDRQGWLKQVMEQSQRGITAIGFQVFSFTVDTLIYEIGFQTNKHDSSPEQCTYEATFDKHHRVVRVDQKGMYDGIIYRAMLEETDKKSSMEDGKREREMS